MDKKKSALITTSAVLSIVAAILGILGAIAIFCLGNMYSEDSVKETYFDNPIYNYHEEDGSYYFYYFEDDMEIIECVSKDSKCKCCPTSNVWKKLYDGINELLDGITLEQMIKGEIK